MTTDQRHALKNDAREFARTLHPGGGLGAGDYGATHGMAPGTGSTLSPTIGTRYALPGGRAAARASAGLPALYDGEDDQDFEEAQDDEDFEDDQDEE